MTGLYTQRKLQTWTIEETRSVLLKIKKKVLQLDPKLTLEVRDLFNDKKEKIVFNFDIYTVKDMYGSHTKKKIRNGQFNFCKTSAVSPDGYSTTSEQLDVVPIRGGYDYKYGFLSIKLSVGNSRSDYSKEGLTRKLEKRVTPTNIDRLDEILNELVTELQRRFKISRENHLIGVKERESQEKLSKSFPDFAEKLGFGRKETTHYSSLGEGNYLNIKKESIPNGTEIELQQRADGDFNLRFAKLNATAVRELLERLK